MTYDEYYCEYEILAALREILRRLYGDGQPLNGDERRDLCNMMGVMLDRIEELPVKDER